MIKDVVTEEEEEEEMWSTVTGKIKHNAGGADETRRVREQVSSVQHIYQSR